MRLRKHYEAAQKFCGNVIPFSPVDSKSSKPADLAAQIRRKARQERDEANARLLQHEKECDFCNQQSQAS